jgi:hypothetical protein
MPPGPTSEGDAFALSMLLVVLCGMGVLALLAFTIFRNAAKRNREVEDLIDEVSDDAPKVKAQTGKTPEAWERDGEWWKKQ